MGPPCPGMSSSASIRCIILLVEQVWTDLDRLRAQM
jgi:hypothetical protein